MIISLNTVKTNKIKHVFMMRALSNLITQKNTLT